MHSLDLFDPIELGNLQLKNRIVMAPMTRSRASAEHVQSEMAVEYYKQRASAGLIITEGTAPSADGEGYARTPGIYNQQQMQAWQKVTNATHQAGGKIFLQIMHVGRIAHPLNKAAGTQTVAPSAIKANNVMMFTDQEGLLEVIEPKELSIDEIKQIVADYKCATENAFAAGFDGVELHAANGYLPMQFLSTNVNQRQDEYGGSVENRVRFVTELLSAMCEVDGGKRVGIRISPGSDFNDVQDDNPYETYSVLLSNLNQYNLAYLHIVGKAMNLAHKPDFKGEVQFDLYKFARKFYSGLIIGNSGFDLDSANQALRDNEVDLVSFGRKYIANPDLVERFKKNVPLNTEDANKLYTPGAEGYIDY